MEGGKENMHQAVKQKINCILFCPVGMKSIPPCSHSSIKITQIIVTDNYPNIIL